MSDLVPTDPAAAELQQISAPEMVKQALEVFRYQAQFGMAFGDSLDEWFGGGEKLRDLTEVRDRNYVALKLAKTKKQRFEVHLQALDLLELIPKRAVLAAAFQSVKKAMAAKPTAKERALLVGKMLDVLCINSDTSMDYAATLVWKLSDCPKQETETLFHRRESWLPIPVIGATINHIWDTYRVEYGKPPSLPDVLEECGRQSDRLIQLYDDLDKLGRTHHHLTRIHKATEDSWPDEDDPDYVPF
jgi:hypothetical protein